MSSVLSNDQMLCYVSSRSGDLEQNSAGWRWVESKPRIVDNWVLLHATTAALNTIGLTKIKVHLVPHT